MNGINMLIELIGGLGLFLFGMKLMGDGLENVAGEKLKSILEKVTNNKYMGVFIGALVTAVIQSSSATTVMVVSFVNAGLINLMQAAGVIMGANVGTTITAQLISCKLDNIAPLFVGIGSISLLITSKKKHRDISSIILGFGILFLGMNFMSNAMKPLAESPIFSQVLILVGNNKLLGVLCGLLMTAVVQSSSATTGILIALATTGTIDMNVALPVIFGCNIGTCVTALLASASGNKTAKKAGLIHFFFNVIGVLIFVPFINPLISFIKIINPTDVARQVANAHTIFNITSTIILLPFTKYLVLLANKILPGNDSLETEGAIYLDKNLLDTPIVATGQVVNETIRMGKIAQKNIELAMKAFLIENEEYIKQVYNNEKIINTLEKEITNYLVLLSNYELPDTDSKVLSTSFHIINDIERIGDHAKNIVELATEKIDDHIIIPPDAIEEIMSMYEQTLNALTLALKCYENSDYPNAKHVKEIESKIDTYEKALRENNIKRLNQKKCSANSSTIFLDLISNLERIGDHSTNIAERVM
ncbi:UNVERIFIED_ORG: sodium-dependent phosphate transporter [Clostridium botulinum]|uniref:Na/Pi cotransporter family protein n=1 Tax=Clostridium botulinum TaxID=1491 RepID=UPI000774A71E|nr:Na/Pi cotransporter family protein [Clostridium botulinum]MBN1057842.1 Na/Pi cotransporter family protein [Clostridium botulinum]MBN1061087.1 Na/Pi cotransporter family protein [Clostridium botulinum]NFE83151.1 Na/Pi cotransporter family protein [Clostridium botulinum]NFF81242.1 Na/Pi cotransporter family protein [Clostridium botulinum]NFG37520.1 Na/Pi cotransporter family protein [Clostridium botulinum]